MTNYEKIKAMSVEEMVAFIEDVAMCEKKNTCIGCVMHTDEGCGVSDCGNWLLQEAEE